MCTGLRPGRAAVGAEWPKSNCKPARSDEPTRYPVNIYILVVLPARRGEPVTMTADRYVVHRAKVAD
jgi:hypothetical protein